MTGMDTAWIPFAVLYILYQIPPTMMEVYSYYSRGGLVGIEDIKYDDTFTFHFQWLHDKDIYLKRYCDRPISEAGKAFFSWLDWSAEAYDRSIYVMRRNHARRDGEVSMWKRYIYGPFVFNWPKKQWLRGDDSCGMRMPAWGVGGEARARQEYAAAKAKGFDKNWHYQIMRKIRREQARKASADAAKA
ncbi:hypothetical protein C3747_55g132 [Trypanosoma cruzi]|uniref:Uncharacterized protein n=2 Tax=Trypanosoma cruzi TaxID=5693 RepID=Q4DWH4_TRYCC|nr:hypothetical protein, conserved [Trypanosoma cruzi]EAN96877.1 hypothetical protein, conserved [Trypanosoma cruzi]KAF8301553.1 hypothetical protein TcYC6_0053240 [Trypanosoma cruzi]PWV11975.1 hypothetical protein C3747_55g132 [Trypanosoma cruzi]|eukprot:XP_818728.1 hypothetical protein [Trypanosoma cruzi strain CL Brener]